jgi:hypothetical protein
MCELDFINPQTLVPDTAVTAYVDMYASDLHEEAIKAIKSATHMGNKKLAKVLVAMVEESDGHSGEMDVAVSVFDVCFFSASADRSTGYVRFPFPM